MWSDRENLHIETSLRSFLLKSAQNACIDHIRHQHVVNNYADSQIILETELGLIDTEKYVFYSDLHDKLMWSLEKLPEKYRQVFELSKLEGLKHKEIAEKLNVSERTVEDRLSKVLILLRKYLKDFLIFLITLFIH